MDERAQVHALLEVLGVRARELGERRVQRLQAVAAAGRELDACTVAFDAERARLDALVTHLGRPDVACSAPRYVETLAVRDVVARDVERERFVTERAGGELEEARAALAEAELEIARLRAREDALRERARDLERERDRRADLADELELDERASIGHALGGAARG